MLKVDLRTEQSVVFDYLVLGVEPARDSWNLDFHTSLFVLLLQCCHFSCKHFVCTVLPVFLFLNAILKLLILSLMH